VRKKHAMGKRRRKRRKGDKKKALKAHSFRRAVERYDLDLTDELRQEIIGQITSNKSSPVEVQSHRVTIHDVELEDGTIVRVAYDKKRGQLITFLHKTPEEYAVTA
jgi:IS30 family transposase